VGGFFEPPISQIDAGFLMLRDVSVLWWPAFLVLCYSN
jgi:hypothetical protein